MIKGALRIFGFLSVALGFVLIVVDGTASIAANDLRYTTLAESLSRFFPKQYPQWEALLAQKLPAVLWDPAALTALRAPTALLLVILGMLLLALGRRREITIGHPARL